jgi:hypothetical protein
MRRVRGILFRDYVRMLRACKSAPYRDDLHPEDLALLDDKTDPDGWYPMETFERYGNAILKHVARGELFPVQLWGRYSASPLATAYPTLVVADPVETLRRFDAMRGTFFDFDAVTLPFLQDGVVHVAIAYQMGMPAEEAASTQTLGFFEGLLKLSGATTIEGALREKSWAGDSRTLAVIRWRR